MSSFGLSGPLFLVSMTEFASFFAVFFGAALGALLVRHRRARARILRLERRLLRRRTVLDLLQDGVVLLDRRGRVLFANPAAATLLGAKSPPQPGAEPEFSAWADPGAATVLTYAQGRETSHRLLESLLGRAVELTSAPASGGTRFLVLRDRSGEEAVDRRRRDFVANASHELQTPLAVIVGLLDLMESSFESAPPAGETAEAAHQRADLLSRAQKNAQSMSEMARDLLGLARAEDPEWQPAAEAVDLVAVCDKVVGRLREKAEAKGLELEWAPAAGDSVSSGIVADPVSLETVVSNLVDNAISYTEAGSVRLSSGGIESGGCFLEVEDTGPGIDPSIQAQIFERFFRGDLAHGRQGGGTGLGLSIVRNLVGRMGGRISVRTQVGEGSCFRVELPSTSARPLPAAGQASFTD